ncbi:hypothetical protein [Cohnella sp. WQ 127256]|uniref:hypothetical protein n=1 Tax=Cohnella sp. WQ 127256 TaxID=2938790 RepID=UPI0021183D1E|nr:hypothetical protein [Cohnella sp. WQ 127256]
MKIYFRDNFFNSGRTEILSESNEYVGEVDLRSSFGSALDVYGVDGGHLYGGKFPMLSYKWIVTGPGGVEWGQLRYRMSFLSKRYEYDSFTRGVYEITSPAFSREYEIHDEKGVLAATFQKESGWFEASAYCLTTFSDDVDSYEWISVVLGMHEIQKRHRSN